jgi:hypothetical protein
VAEGARLESVFTRKGNVGSNPTLSAIFHSKRLRRLKRPAMDSATVEFPIRQTSSVLSRKGCRIKVRLYVREHSSPQIPQSHAEGTDGQYLRALLRLHVGDHRRHQLKQGNSLLRFLLAEAAQVAVRSDPEWPSKYFHLAMRWGRKVGDKLFQHQSPRHRLIPRNCYALHN